MKKTLTFLVGLIMLILVMLLLTSCSANDIELIYHSDNHVFEIVVQNNAIAEDYQDEINLNSALTSYEEDNKVHVLIDMTQYNPKEPADFTNRVKGSLTKLFPQFKDAINSINYEITRDFYGTSLTGTEYYHFTLTSNQPYSIPVKIVCNNQFMFDGQEGVWNEKDSRYDLKVNISTNTEPTTYELEYIVSTISNGTIEIDVSTPSPSIKYRFYHSTKDLSSLEYELASVGMTVEFCDSAQVIFYESYDTNNDFNNIFPIRTFSMFGIVLTTEYKHGSFFTSDGEFTMTIFEVPSHLNVEVTVVGQDNTKFAITQNGKTESIVGNNTSFILDENIQVDAEYSNIRWFSTITSMLVVIAIFAAILCMIWLAKRH